MPNLPSLSIVMIAHNKAHVTRLSLRSLLSLTFRPLEVVFVDNGSTDATPALLEEFAAAAAGHGILSRTLHLPDNMGAIIPRNMATRICSGDFIAYLDNDVMVRSRTLFEILVGKFHGNPEAGVTTPKFVYPCPPYRVQCAGGGITREGDCYLIGRGEERDRPEFNRPASCAWTISACMVMPTDLIRAIGPMDEVFHPIGCEDVDYCFRVRARNRQVLYCPEAEIYHLANTSTYNTPNLKIGRLMKRSNRIIKRRWRHMFPGDPSIKDLPLVHIPMPRVPLWMLESLEMTS